MDPEWREHYFEKWLGLKSVLDSEIQGLVYDGHYEMENGKEIACIYKELKGVSIHNKDTWQETMLFLKENMVKLESVWFDFEDYIKS